MVKSGVIFGVVALVLVLGFSVLLTPFCAPCIGLFLGLAQDMSPVYLINPLIPLKALKKGQLQGRSPVG